MIRAVMATGENVIEGLVRGDGLQHCAQARGSAGLGGKQLWRERECVQLPL